jgi:hypothetical protein
MVMRSVRMLHRCSPRGRMPLYELASVSLVVCNALLDRASVCATAATFSNVSPRKDTTGAIVNAHDGQIVKENGMFYWFAAG